MRAMVVLGSAPRVDVVDGVDEGVALSTKERNDAAGEGKEAVSDGEVDSGPRRMPLTAEGSALKSSTAM